jgi:hypothetical protein
MHLGGGLGTSLEKSIISAMESLNASRVLAFVGSIVLHGVLKRVLRRPVGPDIGGNRSPTKVVVVKFGGSAITQKGTYESLNAKALDLMASQVFKVA